MDQFIVQMLLCRFSERKRDGFFPHGSFRILLHLVRFRCWVCIVALFLPRLRFRFFVILVGPDRYSAEQKNNCNPKRVFFLLHSYDCISLLPAFHCHAEILDFRRRSAIFARDKGGCKTKVLEDPIPFATCKSTACFNDCGSIRFDLGPFCVLRNP